MRRPHCIEGIAGLFLISWTVGCGSAQQREPGTVSEVARSHENCYGGGAFLPIDSGRLAEALPDGFVLRDASFLGPEFEGKGSWGVAGWTCPGAQGSEPHSFVVVVTLIEPPAAGNGFADVGLHWYEHARLVDGEELYGAWHDFGLNVDRGAFADPGLSERDSTAVISIEHDGAEVVIINTDLSGATDFPAQVLLFWQSTPEGILYSRFEFESHRSWLGGLSDCQFAWSSILDSPLSALPCPEAGLVEVIEQITFASAAHRWRPEAEGSN